MALGECREGKCTTDANLTLRGLQRGIWRYTGRKNIPF